MKPTVIRAGRRVYNVNLKKKKFKGPKVLVTPQFLPAFVSFICFYFQFQQKWVSIVTGKLIELASSTIGQRAKTVLGHRAKLGQRAKSS